MVEEFAYLIKWVELKLISIVLHIYLDMTQHKFNTQIHIATPTV
jgi:hypothetical protein